MLAPPVPPLCPSLQTIGLKKQPSAPVETATLTEEANPTDCKV